jgi:peroxiredoxin
MNKVLIVLTALSISLVSFSQSKKIKATKPAKNVVKKETKVPTPIIKVNDNKDGGHDITLTLSPAKNQKAYLACYYGKGKALVDSCMLDDKCVGHFKGDKKLVGGIYFVVSQSYSIQFEVLIGDVQNFKIIGDTTHKDKFEIVGSPDNDLFKTYSKKTADLGAIVKKIEDKYKDAKTKADTTEVTKEWKIQNAELNKYRDEIVEKNPNTLMAALLTAMKRPETPEIPVDPITKKGDSSYPFRYVKEHYFDDVNIADERLLRTPFFENKIDEYLKYYVSSDADSIIPEIKYFLLSARESKEMYAYLLTKFTNKYLNPEFMGQDKVFVHLFTDYYLRGDTSFLDSKSKKTIIDRGYSMMLGLIGNTAPPLDLVDTTGKVITLYNIKAKFTVVAYWDPTCGHCRQELPSLDSMYRAKWKEEDVKIYSITSKDDLVPELKKFIKEKNLSSDWYYTYETKAAKEATEKAGVPNYRQAYDFNKTPIFYILDADKKIIGKQLTIHQIDDLITRKLKSGK